MCWSWPLRIAPEIENRNLVDAGNRAVRSAGFFCQIFAVHVLTRVFLELNRGIAALLRTVMHQPVFADIEIARTRATAPLVRTS